MAASPKKYDIFDIVFDVLSDSLTTNTPSINLACNIEDKLTNIVWKEIKHKSTLRMNELRHMRQLMIKRYMTLISVKLQSLRTVEESKRLHLESCSCQEVSTKRRLTIQKTGSDKRLKELVFEIIGEYGKSNVRITRRRSEYSVYSVYRVYTKPRTLFGEDGVLKSTPDRMSLSSRLASTGTTRVRTLDFPSRRNMNESAVTLRP